MNTQDRFFLALMFCSTVDSNNMNDLDFYHFVALVVQNYYKYSDGCYHSCRSRIKPIIEMNMIFIFFLLCLNR